MSLIRIPLLELGDNPEKIAARVGVEQVGAELMRDPYVNYADFIRTVLKEMPEGGFAPAQIKMTMAILDILASAVDNDSEDLLVNQAMHAYLIERLQAFRWRIAHARVLRFINDIENAEPL